MAENEKGEETIPRANDWEVVSLTASAYAAAPGPVQVELKNNDKTNMVEEDEAETSKAMLMSHHFAFPQSEHEKVGLEPESIEISSINESNDMISDVRDGDGGVSKKKDCDNWDGIRFYNEEEHSLSFDEVKFRGETTFEGLNLTEKELSMFKNEATMHVEEIVGHEQVEPAEGGTDLEVSQISIEDQNNGRENPYQAWWKKHAIALYAQAKEANAFWSIFVAATVMGLVILGQHWQLERWQILQLRWQFGVNNENMAWMLSPVSRLKDVIVGGNKRGFLNRSSSLVDKD